MWIFLLYSFENSFAFAIVDVIVIVRRRRNFFFFIMCLCIDENEYIYTAIWEVCVTYANCWWFFSTHYCRFLMLMLFWSWIGYLCLEGMIFLAHAFSFISLAWLKVQLILIGWQTIFKSLKITAFVTSILPRSFVKLINATW